MGRATNTLCAEKEILHGFGHVPCHARQAYRGRLGDALIQRSRG